MEQEITHPKNKAIQNKNPNNPKKESRFDYDIIKDKRFTEDKYFFHLPVTLNFKSSSSMKPYPFNQEVLKFLNNNKHVNIIGIDRGERHLAYYTVINQAGKILKQGSFNSIAVKYKNKGNKPVESKTDYHALLETREKERDKSRKSWHKIENIKELKQGYLSHLVHQLSKLMIQHNAIVVFEDLNFGFKRGRMKFEKQVYQKLEKALIDKLNYLVFKDISNPKDPGGYLNAYQLTAPFESFKKMGKQTGFVFYTSPHYTSKACPLTGFVNLVYPRYKNIEKSQSFFKNFEKIYFDKSKDYFVFEYRDSKLNPSKTSESDALWKVCAQGKERYKYDKTRKTHVKRDVTQELKSLFEKYNIDYKEKKDLKEDIAAVAQRLKKDQKEFFEKLTNLFQLTLELRHINPNAKEDKERDFILSPVSSESGQFFDSRKAGEGEPQNADANGAYHIALKGLWMLKNLNSRTGTEEERTTKSKPGKITIPRITNKDWFEFIKARKNDLNKKAG